MVARSCSPTSSSSRMSKGLTSPRKICTRLEDKTTASTTVSHVGVHLTPHMVRLPPNPHTSSGRPRPCACAS
jgi:hypothetical protein